MAHLWNISGWSLRTRGWLVLLLALVLAGISPTSGYALPGDPIDDPIDDIGESETYVQPAGGFEWGMPRRFGYYKDGMIDYHWNAETRQYDQAHINPSGGFQVDFFGCATQADAEATPGHTTLTYKWQVIGADGSPTRTDEGKNCRWSPKLAEGKHTVRLTLAPKSQGAPDYYQQQVQVEDLFVVSIGDSYGSGEGNPDVPQKFDDFGFVKAGPRWQDKLCHRSAYAGAAQAALAIEGSDAKSSVTFVSLACSGATIDTPTYIGDLLHPDGNPQKPQGTGVLGHYRGVEPADPDNFDPARFLAPQIQALKETANGRQIDALVVSGGGNDLGFANIIADCVWHNIPRILDVTAGKCHEQPKILNKLAAAKDALPGKYDALATAIASNLKVKNVYFTEYPDPTTDDDGTTCSSMLGEILPSTPFDFAKIHIDRDEANWARSRVVEPLNAMMAEAADRANANHPTIGWSYVGGIASQYRGHGYCADNHWVVQAYESTRQQGPAWGTTTSWGPILFLELQNTKGMMHPNRAGHMAYARRLIPAIRGSQGAGPSFSTANSAGGVSAKEGKNGWLTGWLDGSGVHRSDKAVFSVTAQDPSGIAGASIKVNGADCADGIACDAQIASDGKSVTWAITATRDGVYDLQLSARNRNGAASSLAHQLKVDLHDPGLPVASVAAGATTGENGWYRSKVQVEFSAPQPEGLTATASYNTDSSGSGVALVQYSSPSIKNGEQFTSMYENGVGIEDDGTHTITYKVEDRAGRSSGTGTFTVKIDKTVPTIGCDAPDGQWHKDDVSVACTASDATSGLANSADASFSLATSVAVETETADAQTGTRQVCDVADNCETAGPVGGNKVDKKAPEITLPSPAASNYILNQPVAADFSCADGGSGVATCEGTVADGANVDTTSVGKKSFSLSATDNVGNTANRAVEYEVTYKIHALYDQTKAHKIGSVVPVKLQLQDYDGANKSSAGIVVNATGLTKQDDTASTTVVSDAGNSNPDSNFRYDATLGGYVYNLKTTGLTIGTWRVSFKATGDNVPHAVKLDAR